MTKVLIFIFIYLPIYRYFENLQFPSSGINITLTLKEKHNLNENNNNLETINLFPTCTIYMYKFLHTI